MLTSRFYLRQDSVEVFNQGLHPRCRETDVLAVVSCSHEFDGLKAREGELKELKKLVEGGACPCDVKVHLPMVA